MKDYAAYVAPLVGLIAYLPLVVRVWRMLGSHKIPN